MVKFYSKQLIAPLWFWLGLLLFAVFAMQTMGQLHAVLHPQGHGHEHAHKHADDHEHTAPAQANATFAFGHKEGSLACAVWEIVASAATPLLACSLDVLPWFGNFVLAQIGLNLHLAFLLQHPPLARAPPWF